MELNQSKSNQTPETSPKNFLWGELGVNLIEVQKKVGELNRTKTYNEFKQIADQIRDAFRKEEVEWDSESYPTVYFDTDAPDNDNLLIVDWGDYEIAISENYILLRKKPEVVE